MNMPTKKPTTKKPAAKKAVASPLPTPTELPVEKINHPNHYKHVSGVECIDVAEQLGFNLGNAFKYMFRAGRKTGESWLEDAKKSRFYLVRWVGGDIIGASNESGGDFDAYLCRNLAELASVEDQYINNIEDKNLHEPKDGNESALATHRLLGAFVNALLELEDKNHVHIAVFMDLLNTKIHMIETFAKSNIAIPQ